MTRTQRRVAGFLIQGVATLMKPRCWPRIGGVTLGLAVGASLALEIASQCPGLAKDRRAVFLPASIAAGLAWMLMKPVKRDDPAAPRDGCGDDSDASR
jgi:hypothetical protein